ncbi:transcriptional regulator [Citreicella sp. SE45]|nr:transcriptional regulator [Citreicella sp. SE45]
MPKVTAKLVAERAGVSVAAVSRAFQPGAPLAPEKRALVLRIAQELGYVPPAARSLSQLGTRSVSLVAGDLTNPFYSGVLELLSQELHKRGRRLTLHAVPPGETVDVAMEQVLGYRADAAIVTSAHMSSELVRRCREANLPVVLLNRVQPDSRMTAVTCDNHAGGRLIAARFLASGRQRIGHMTGVPDTSTHIERSRGFLDRLAEADRAPVVSACGGFSYAGAMEAAADMLDGGPRPDAVFCENDVMALALIDAARARGLRVPEDLAVIGFDDIPMAGWQSYRLTTVRQPIRRMVAEALTLIEQLQSDGAGCGAIRVLPVDLVARDTG